ncbi:hypothetical protein Pelo_18050 [Pelomyxa schiedti]|nr:hypothetical protein Pelo_18050 [Pelomyxa schiedti]
MIGGRCYGAAPIVAEFGERDTAWLIGSNPSTKANLRFPISDKTTAKMYYNTSIRFYPAVTAPPPSSLKVGCAVTMNRTSDYVIVTPIRSLPVTMCSTLDASSHTAAATPTPTPTASPSTPTPTPTPQQPFQHQPRCRWHPQQQQRLRPMSLTTTGRRRKKEREKRVMNRAGPVENTLSFVPPYY